VKKTLTGLLIAMSMAAVSGQNLVERVPAQRGSRAKWIRRATLVAGCAASLAFDTLSTRRAVANGAVESNGLLSNPNESVSWGRVVGLKAGFCGVSAAMQETHVFGLYNTPKSDWTWIAVNAGTASVYTWAGFHNLSLAPAR
jgi:hypothetical protein